MFSTG